MHVIQGRNVSDIYPRVLELVRREGRVQDSRNGPVLVLDTPFLAVYERPDEMVLLDPARNANAAFHLVEALWMLAGRNDADYLNNYVSDFGARFASEFGTLDGAYGLRWRSHFDDARMGSGWDLDQIQLAIDKLEANPLDRRVVIQMWDPFVDNNPYTKDACCNQQLFPRIVNGALDMTVTCRSNDAVWGAMGANAVHFPFLQRYMAGRLGLPVGRFYQFSNNYHIYEQVLGPLGTPAPLDTNPYSSDDVTVEPLADDWSEWDNDLVKFMDWHDRLWSPGSDAIVWEPDNFVNSWFTTTACRVVMAYWHHKRKQYSAAESEASQIKAPDWRAGVRLWMENARVRRNARSLAAGTTESPTEEVPGETASTEAGDVRPAQV